MIKVSMLVTISAMLFFTGCSIKQNYNSKFDNNTNSKKEYNISGNLENFIDSGFFSSKSYIRIVIYIDNELIIKAPLNVDYSGNIELSYKDKPLTVECGKDNVFKHPSCIIFIGKEKAGQLNFKPDYL